ncbi:MAG TPA: hypothetical protein PKA63_01090 [Oligoflexia bacterium]|nr:hypothetical protein [Oligoflexia bacterium]HMP47244.1 hypothetical protein [Oligoflexia bacterium]
MNAKLAISYDSLIEDVNPSVGSSSGSSSSKLSASASLMNMVGSSGYSLSVFNNEYTASQVRLILQELFPSRKLVLSQLTFFNQMGISVPSGNGFRRGRRLYRLRDLLPIAVVLALKEQGIPNKNVELAPACVQEHADEIFKLGSPVRLSGIGEIVHLDLGRISDNRKNESDKAIEFLLSGQSMDLFWSYDVGFLALELSRVCTRLHVENKLDNDPVSKNSSVTGRNESQQLVGNLSNFKRFGSK